MRRLQHPQDRVDKPLHRVGHGVKQPPGIVLKPVENGLGGIADRDLPLRQKLHTLELRQKDRRGGGKRVTARGVGNAR